MLLRAVMLATLLAAALPCASAADKPEPWVEVRSPHFRVISNASEKQARRAAGQFERFRDVLKNTFTKMKVDSSAPMLIIAVKDEKSLQSLLPEYWERKGSVHPAGYFLRSLGKNFVVLRLDATGEYPFHVIYHEYVHNVMALNFKSLPLWVNEGVAEFFGYATTQGDNAGTGRPSAGQLNLLMQNRLLPLATLLTANHQSPYYNEAEKTSMFYAQSWALTHYLFIGDKGARRPQLLTFLNLVADGVPDVEAAQRAFGDLKKLESNLADYVRLRAFYYLPVKLSNTGDEKQFAARSVPEAEALAARGDFLLHHGRFAEAQPMLEEALRLDPKQALAEESLGFYYFRKGDREQAARHFSAAVQMDSANFLAHFYYANLSARSAFSFADSAATPGDTEKDDVETHLRRAIELNPEFAPAYSTLASHYALRGNKLDVAFQLALRAAQLEPGVVAYQINLANVLLRMDRAGEAVALAQRSLAAATSDADRAAVQSFLTQAARYQTYVAEKHRYEEESAAAQKKWQEEQSRRAQELKAEEEAAKKSEAEQKNGKPPSKTPSRPARRASLVGKIVDVTCGPPAILMMAVRTADGSVSLHANNYFKIEFYTLTWKPPDDFQPCLHLTGLSVKVTYEAVDGQSYIGEITNIEVR